jgi:hypothetical protein
MLNHKKLLSAALACAMAASLAVPTFAASSSESTTNRSLKVTAAYQAVPIAVVVPTTGTVIINPYSLPVEIGTDADGVAVKVQKQITTKPLAIKNQGDIALDVNVSTTTALTGTLKLLTEDVKDDDTSNSAFIYMDVVKSTTLKGSTDDVNAAAVATAYKDQAWKSDDDGALVLKSGTQTQAKIVTLAGNTYDDNKFAEYAEGSIALIGFDGSCVKEPKTAWTTKDGLTCTIAFTFTPADTTSSESTD